MDFGASSLPEPLIDKYDRYHGVPLSALLFNNQFGEADLCNKEDCNPCRSGTTKRLSCRKVSRGRMVYSCTCISCKLAVEEKVSMYHGRSARTLYTRQGEHIGGCQAGKVDNALFKHAQLHHQGLVPEFQLPVPDATSAQIFSSGKSWGTESRFFGEK